MKKDSDAFIDKILGKRNSEMIRDCCSIFALFDPNDPPFKTVKPFPLGDLLCELTGWDKFIELIRKENDDVVDFLEFRLSNIAFDAGIGIGFVLGNMFDIQHPKIKESVERIRKILIKKEITPFVPREKKPGQRAV